MGQPINDKTIPGRDPKGAEFPDNLARTRRDRRLTQVQLADLLGVQPRLVSRWETGESKPQFDHVVRLAEALQVTLDQLVRGERAATAQQFDIRNKRLEELCRQVDHLGKEDQDVVCYVMDSFLRREQIRTPTHGSGRIEEEARS